MEKCSKMSSDCSKKMKRKRIVVEKKRCQMKNELPVTNCAYKKTAKVKKIVVSVYLVMDVLEERAI